MSRLFLRIWLSFWAVLGITFAAAFLIDYALATHHPRAEAFDAWDILLQPWVLAVLVVSISGAGSALLARSLTAPIRTLHDRVRAIAAGDLDARTGPRLTRRRDEIGVLARALDEMSGRLKALLGARDDVLRDVSHELRAPLARLRAGADLARRRGGGDPGLDRMDREIDRIDALLGQIISYSRLQSDARPPRIDFDLAEVVAAAVDDARIEGAAVGKDIVFEPAGPVAFSGDPELIRSAAENMLRNAVRFSPEGGRIDVDVAAKAGEARIEVRDRGPGVDPGDLPQIFEAFCGEGSGAGLGLAITRRIAALHGGAVAGRNREGGGFEIVFSAPQRPPEGRALETSLQNFAVPGHT